MLRQLRIENIILIESAEIPFERGLNILSGETGAGKSAVMQALRLIAGEKGDPKLIRHGSDKGVVEALFEPFPTSPVWALLEGAGIRFDREEPLVIKREVSAQGKSRAFINHQFASLTLLKEVGEALFDIASQHASQKLVSEAFQRSVVDAWGSFEEEVKAFTKSWEEECLAAKELLELTQNEARRLREVESLERQIAEIKEAGPLAQEDESLFRNTPTLSPAKSAGKKQEK